MTTTTTQTLTRNDIIKTLKKGECQIAYKKQSTGKRDKITGTLNTEIAPELLQGEGKLGGDNKELILFWSTDRNDYRAIRTNSIISIKEI